MGTISANLFSQLNTNKATISDAEQMGYEITDFGPETDPDWKAEMLAGQQYLDENEITAALESGKLSYSQVGALDTAWGPDGKITQSEFTENIEAANACSPEEAAPVQGVGDANEFEQVICGDSAEGVYGIPVFGVDFGQTAVLDTPEVNIVQDRTNNEEITTVTVKDPSQVRIVFGKISCDGMYGAGIDTNNDGVADIGLTDSMCIYPGSIFIVINGKKVNLGDFMYEHQDSYQNMAESMLWNWEEMASGGWLGPEHNKV